MVAHIVGDHQVLVNAVIGQLKVDQNSSDALRRCCTRTNRGNIADVWMHRRYTVFKGVPRLVGMDPLTCPNRSRGLKLEPE